MKGSSFSKPLLLQDGKPLPIERVQFDERFRDENWLQELLFTHPELIPFNELDPLFRNSVPIAREVESGVGPIDILFANDDGLLTIVETKLWRNPEARREVIAQIINYAAELSKMGYDELARAVKEATGSTSDALVKAVRDGNPSFDEKRFHDGLSANLKHGRFLLIVIGDGIREDVESMAEFLSRQPQLGFTLRLIEIVMYRLDRDGMQTLLVQPQIVARTREVVRAIVEVRGDKISVQTPPELPTERGSRAPISPDQYFAELAANVTPKAVEFARWAIEQAPGHSLEVQWMQGGPVFKFVDANHDVFFTLGQFDRGGFLSSLSRFSSRCNELGFPRAIWEDYFQSLVQLIPGSSRKHFTSKAGNEWDDLVYDDSKPALDSLADSRDRWFEAVDRAVARVKAELEKTPPSPAEEL